MGKDLKGKDLGTGFTQRRDGLYSARAMISNRRIELYGRNLKELREQFAEAKKQTLYDIANEIPSKDVTLSEWFAKWYEIYKQPYLKDTAKYSYATRFINFYGNRMGQKPLKDIRQIHIQNVISELIDLGRAPSSIREATGILQNCLDGAVANGLIAGNPANGVVVPKSGKVTRRVLTREEQKIFLDFVHRTHSWYEELYLILFLTGIRIGEAGGLQWNDIDFVNKFIHINRSLAWQYKDGQKQLFLTEPKTANSYRAIPFFGETKDVLLAQKEKMERLKKQMGTRWGISEEFGNLVFATSKGTPIGRYTIERDMRCIISQINDISANEAKYTGEIPIVMERIYPHALRHTFATRCLESGMTPRIVQEIMGHSNYNTTVSYTHVLDDMKQIEAARIGNFLEIGKLDKQKVQEQYGIIAGLI